MCYGTLDTDAIGSCRLPASCCGVVGFKGTYGLIDNKGVLEGEQVDQSILWLAHAAITARSVEEAAILLDVLAEPCSTSTATEKPRLGIATSFSASEEVELAFEKAVSTFRGLGYPTCDASAPFQSPGFDVSSIQADRNAVGQFFDDFDLILLPTTAASTPKIKDAIGNPLLLSAANTMFANYYGLPAISVPCGYDANGLPLGLQIVGKPTQERSVLGLAHHFERVTVDERVHPIQ
jgi:aspartyl-tRNA(Asn)/glutamyl-tRNA(Gln) amidotransferase subunit A